MPRLEREANAPARRRGRALWISASAAAGAAVACWWAHPVTPPMSVSLTIAPPPPAAAPATCPAPPPPAVALPVAGPASSPLTCPPADPPWDPAIGEPYTADATSGHILDGRELVGVAASPRRYGRLAVWSETRIWFSNTDGRTFAPVLEAPGPIADVALDCRGAVLAVRGEGAHMMLGQRDPGGAETWRPLAVAEPGTDPKGAEVQIAAGGSWLVAVAHLPFAATENTWRLLVSSDRGATWRRQPLADIHGGVEYVDIGRIGRRVELVAKEGDCRYDGTVLHRIDLATGRPAKPVDLSYRDQLPAAVSGRWVYTLGACAAGLCALDLRRDAPVLEDVWEVPWRPAAAPALPGDRYEGTLVRSGGRLWAHWHDQIFRLRGGKAHPAGHLADAIRVTAGDSSGRLLGLVEGRLVRWSRRRALRQLRGQPVATPAPQVVDNPPPSR